MIYIHIPYCHQKCTYCAFYSTPSRNDRQPYVDTLCRELVLRSSEQAHPIRTLYLGGGTPSILTAAQLQQIANTLSAHYDLSQLKEATLEANPEDLTPEFLRQLGKIAFSHDRHFNRLSIGIQSFRDTDLRTINRRHTALQAVEAVRHAHSLGFSNISVDLIYGLPNQTVADWQSNLEQLSLIEPCITHLSCYALSIEPGTMLHRQVAEHRIVPADEDSVLEEYRLLQQWIQAHGWHQYEISSYCKSGYHSRHNSRYWDSTPYLGIGAGAHSFNGTQRRWNVSDITRYIEGLSNGSCYYETEDLTPADRLNEYLMTSLRTVKGIDLEYLGRQFPWATEQLRPQLQSLVDKGFLIPNGQRLSPTTEGLLHADGLASDLFVL